MMSDQTDFEKFNKGRKISKMVVLIQLLALLLTYIVFAYVVVLEHDKNVYYSCLEHGTSGTTTFYKKFKCHVD